MYRGGLISIEDLSNEEIEDVLDLAGEMSEDIRGHSSLAQGNDNGQPVLRAQHPHPRFFRVGDEPAGRACDIHSRDRLLFHGEGRDAGGYHKGME